MDCRLPPESIITMWGTWLEAALFYSGNFSKFKELVYNIEDDAQSVKKLKSILSTKFDKKLIFLKIFHILTF